MTLVNFDSYIQGAGNYLITKSNIVSFEAVQGDVNNLIKGFYLAYVAKIFDVNPIWTASVLFRFF